MADSIPFGQSLQAREGERVSAKVESVPLPIWCIAAGIASGMVGGHWDISWHTSIFVQIKRAGEIETGVFDARVQ